MASNWSDLPSAVVENFRKGSVIPAHPLALDENRNLDERHQRALTRYYIDAGVGGLAVGVHTTQFAIREAGLYQPILELAARTASEWTSRPLILIAGLAGNSSQAVREASVARSLGYNAGLLSLAAMKGVSEDELIDHCGMIARKIPLIGFYLQKSVGGLTLPTSFWRRFAAIDNVIGIKVAPFTRYGTLDVIRGVVAARAEDRVTLYTGNDDHILLDLITPFCIPRDGGDVQVRFRGGLLGHWCVWTRRACELLTRIQAAVETGHIDSNLLALDSRITDCNSAFFDAANDFAGCIAGCHAVLRRQGLLRGIWCLDPKETLSPGQEVEIDRVCRVHPELNDDAFVKANLNRWLS